jgi:hypothetical protein
MRANLRSLHCVPATGGNFDRDDKLIYRLSSRPERSVVEGPALCPLYTNRRNALSSRLYFKARMTAATDVFHSGNSQPKSRANFAQSN